MSEPMEMSEALQHARTFHAKFIRPWSKILEVLENAEAAEEHLRGLRSAIETADQRIADANAMAEQAERMATEKKQAVAEEIAQAQTAHQEAMDSAQAAADAVIAACLQRRQEATDQADITIQNLATEIAGLTKERDALTAQRDALHQEMDALATRLKR